MKLLKWMVICNLTACSLFAQTDQPWKVYYDSTQGFWEKDWDKTVTLLEHAERSALTDLGIYHENYLTILNDLGTAYWKARKYSQAEKALKKSLDLKSEVYAANDKEVMLSLSNLAGFYAEQGSWNKSRILYNRILQSDPAHMPPDIYVSAAQSVVSLYEMDHHPDSANLLLSMIEARNVIPVNSQLAFRHQFYRARVHRKLQQYDQAEKELDKLIRVIAARKDPGLSEIHIQCLQEQGILFLQTGSYGRAEKSLLDARQRITAEMNGGSTLTEVLNNLAQVYDKLNIYDKALQYYQESLTRCKESYQENSLQCSILENNIAGVHLKQNNITQAIQDYQRVIKAFDKLLSPSDPLFITALNNLATAYRKNGQMVPAMQNLQRAEKLLKNKGAEKDDLLAAVLNNIAVINTAQGDYEQAARYYAEAFKIRKSIYGENSVLLLEVLSNLAVTYWALDKPKEAVPLFKKSMELASRQVAYIFPNLNENEQIQFYEKLKEDFERFNAIAVQWADLDDELLSRMFQNRTTLKSLQFFTHLRRRNNIGLKNDPQLHDLVSRLKDYHEKLGHVYQLPLSQIGMASNPARLEMKIDSLEKLISLRSNESTSEGTIKPVAMHSVLSKLKDDEAIVEIVRFRKYDRQTSKKRDYFGFTDSVYYAALILTKETKEKPDLVVLKDGNNLETRYYNYYKNAMKYNVADELSYRLFWEPIQHKVGGKRRIYFSADGVYHRINVNTLRDPVTRGFLLHKFDIVYLLNPTQVLEQKTPSNQIKRNAVLMGDPMFDSEIVQSNERTAGNTEFAELPGTQQELRAIDKLLKSHAWKTSLLLKEAATEDNLKGVRSPGILHLASHGFFSADIVALNSEAKKEFLFHSGIVLTGANKSMSTASTSFHNDGIVTAFEVMNLDLQNTHLVVLSACETGLGKIENGEGVFGLQRSFMQAGAKNVLISLWKVDDKATRDLMIKFYQYLATGNSLQASLKKAQSDQAGLLSNPALWGGFVLVGNH